MTRESNAGIEPETDWVQIAPGYWFDMSTKVYDRLNNIHKDAVIWPIYTPLKWVFDSTSMLDLLRPDTVTFWDKYKACCIDDRPFWMMRALYVLAYKIKNQKSDMITEEVARFCTAIVNEFIYIDEIEDFDYNVYDFFDLE